MGETVEPPDGYQSINVEQVCGVSSQTINTSNLMQWMRKSGKDCPEYLVVAYITSHFSEPEDSATLHKLARRATRDAGLQCYWTSENCISEAKGSCAKTSLDIWRISDVIRGCKQLVVALKAPSSEVSVEALLGAWAGSIWTLPELLLSPGKHFKVYYYSGSLEAREQGLVTQSIPKNHFPARCLTENDDRYQVRRLLDHYLGSLRLSDLELMTVALKCFSSRTAGSDDYLYLPGDYSYALMGLLSRRPNINPTDSAFLAFARYVPVNILLLPSLPG